jgi:hypothetical protein
MTLRLHDLARSACAAVALACCLAGCKQGEGEVCQIDDDCESGLECNAGTNLCQKRGTAATGADAGTVDANIPDAAVPDAGIDAATFTEPTAR